MKIIKRVRKILSWCSSRKLSLMALLFVTFTLTPFAPWNLQNEKKWFAGLVVSNSVAWFGIAILTSILLMATIDIREKFLLKKHKSIELDDRSFFEKDWLIFYLNCLLKIIGYFIVTISFTNFLSVLWVTAVTWINYLITNRNSTKKVEKEGKRKEIYRDFLSVSDKNVVKIITWSLLLSFSLPWFSKLIESDHLKKLREVIEKNFTAGEELIKGVPLAVAIKTAFEVAKKAPLLAITFYYSRSVVNKSTPELQSFWTGVNSIEKRKNLFRFFFNVQKTKNLTNSENSKFFMIVPCQGNYEMSPSFIKRKYLDQSSLSKPDIISDLEKTMKFIEAIEAKVGNTEERNYLLSKMFNEYQSIEQLVAKKNKLVKS